MRNNNNNNETPIPGQPGFDPRRHHGRGTPDPRAGFGGFPGRGQGPQGWGMGRGQFPGFGPGGFQGGLPGNGFGGPRRSPRGGIRLGLLALLAEKNLNGYSLMQAFEAKTNGYLKPKSGSIYPALGQLVEDGLLEVDEAGEYKLTEAGQAQVDAQKEQITAFFQSFNQKSEESELQVAFRKLMSAFQSLSKDGDEIQHAAIISKMDELRREIYKTLSD